MQANKSHLDIMGISPHVNVPTFTIKSNKCKGNYHNTQWMVFFLYRHLADLYGKFGTCIGKLTIYIYIYCGKHKILLPERHPTEDRCRWYFETVPPAVARAEISKRKSEDPTRRDTRWAPVPRTIPRNPQKSKCLLRFLVFGMFG